MRAAYGSSKYAGISWPAGGLLAPSFMVMGCHLDLVCLVGDARLRYGVPSSLLNDGRGCREVWRIGLRLFWLSWSEELSGHGARLSSWCVECEVADVGWFVHGFSLVERRLRLMFSDITRCC